MESLEFCLGYDVEFYCFLFFFSLDKMDHTLVTGKGGATLPVFNYFISAVLHPWMLQERVA